MSEKRGQLDALLDVELVLGNSEAATSPDRPPSGNSDVRAAASLVPGTRLGKYDLVKLLGTGGMGAVWQARDTDLDRAIALKVMRPGLVEDGVARGRLLREARAMARLRHPNVITVFDVETIERRDVIAMELIEGETMANWLARERRPLGRIVAAALAAGRGLAAAHAAGVMHRDFKPHNVLVEAGRIVVTDFGLARAVGELSVGGEVPSAAVDGEATVPDRPSAEVRDSAKTIGALDATLTVPGAVLGTPAYMAPEQLEGRAVDERADQFSFCVTMWEALAGARPFPGDTFPAIAAAIATGIPRAPDRIPRRLRAILLRGLERDPAERWPSMDALLHAITRAWKRPRKIALGLGAAIAIAIAVLVVRHQTTRSVEWRPQIVDLPAFEENSDGPAFSPDGKLIAYVSDREKNGEFRVYVTPTAGGTPREITKPGEHFQTPRWTRDGKALLLVRWDPKGFRYQIVRQPLDGGPFVDLGTGIHVDDCGDALAICDQDRTHAWLFLQHADGTRTELAVTTTESIAIPRCDRSGQRIVFTRGRTSIQSPASDLFVIDRNRREVRLTHDQASMGGTFTPDGRSVVFSAKRDGKTQLYEVPATGGVARQLTFEAGSHLSPDVSPDGRTVAFDHDTTSMMVFVGGGGSPPRKLTTTREVLVSVMPTRDGAFVIAERLRDEQNEIVVISTRDGSERTLAFGTKPFLSVDDRRVLFRAPTANELQAIPIEGGPITTITKLPGELVAGADGPDGQHLEVTRDGKTMWYRVVDGRVEPEADGLVFAAPSGGWRAVRTFATGYRFRLFAPDATTSQHEITAESTRPMWLDDHRFAYAANGAFHIVDVTTGAEVATVAGPDWGELAILAPDGVHWYDIQLVGHVTRHLLVNFADRHRSL